MPIHIQPIEPHQFDEAKRVIMAVARSIFTWEEPLDELIRRYEDNGELSDLADPQAYSAEQQGIFLVALDQGRVVGTGAVRRWDGSTAELKRLWLLEAYHGQGIGYRLLQALLQFAREEGYRRIRLQTGVQQSRARQLYRRVGFETIPCDTDDPEDICMEMAL